jgi:hypothetical protein
MATGWATTSSIKMRSRLRIRFEAEFGDAGTIRGAADADLDDGAGEPVGEPAEQAGELRPLGVVPPGHRARDQLVPDLVAASGELPAEPGQLQVAAQMPACRI